MSHALQANHMHTLVSAYHLPMVARWSVAFAAAVTTWDMRHRTRKQLGRLSEQHLRDVGIDPMTADFEARKSFWQG